MDRADGFGRGIGTSPSTPVGAAFAAAMVLGIGLVAGHWVVVIYVLSFWHYLLYALAFVFREIPLRVFERDAVLMKSVSLLAFGSVYLTATPDILSLLVVAVGLLLNLIAASRLGTDRTYYGYELAGLPPKRVTDFPYSVLAHPMLTGNAVAFAGTLLNPGFRAEWWPLALSHVALNLAILVMEIRARPRRLARPTALDRHGWLLTWQGAVGIILFATLLAGTFGSGLPLVSGLVLAVLVYGAILLESYAWNGRTGANRA